MVESEKILADKGYRGDLVEDLKWFTSRPGNLKPSEYWKL
jgi:hypothetical protein